MACIPIPRFTREDSKAQFCHPKLEKDKKAGSKSLNSFSDGSAFEPLSDDQQATLVFKKGSTHRCNIQASIIFQYNENRFYVILYTQFSHVFSTCWVSMTQGRNSMIGHSRSKLQSRPTLACDKRRFFSGPWMKTFVLGSHRKALRIFWNAESVQQQLCAGYIL